MNKTIIKDAGLDDLKYVAKIHKEIFHDHYLGQFSETLIEKFYQVFIHSDIIFLVSETNGVVNGFVLGGESKKINYCKSSFIKI